MLVRFDSRLAEYVSFVLSTHRHIQSHRHIHRLLDTTLFAEYFASQRTVVQYR